MALALGARVTLVTNLPPGYDVEALDGLDLCTAVAPACRYANSYSAAGRTQLLLDPGQPLEAALASAPARCDILVVAPAYHELAAFPCIAAPITAVALQGLLRDTQGQRVVPHRDPWAQVEAFLRPGVFAFFSEEDTPEPEDLARRGAVAGATVLLTRGPAGAEMYAAGGTRHFAAIPACATDPTGAGDCFSAAFLVRYAETGDIGQAGRFGAAAGALAVEGTGLAGIPTREALEARLRKAAA
jgi:hypothetical protein